MWYGGLMKEAIVQFLAYTTSFGLLSLGSLLYGMPGVYGVGCLFMALLLIQRAITGRWPS